MEMPARTEAGDRRTAAEPAITFEQKHHLYGAVSDADREARRGNYYTVFFRTLQMKPSIQKCSNETDRNTAVSTFHACCEAASQWP